MSMGKADILFFAGDPGAANIIRFVCEVANDAGYEIVTYADEDVLEFLAARKVFSRTVEGLSAEDILSRHCPKIVVVGSSVDPNSRGLDLIEAAREQDTPTVGIVDAMMSTLIRYSRGTANPFLCVPDWLVVTNHETKENWMGMGFDSARIMLIQHPQQAIVRQRARFLSVAERANLRNRLIAASGNVEGVGNEQKLIVFVAEPEIPSENFSPVTGDLWKYTESSERCHVALQSLLAALNQLGYSQSASIVLKLHPKNIPEDFLGYQSCVANIDQYTDGTDLILAADAIVGMTSSLLIEASFTGNPCLSIISREADRNELPREVEGQIERASSQEELEHWLTCLFNQKKIVQRNVPAIEGTLEILTILQTAMQTRDKDEKRL